MIGPLREGSARDAKRAKSDGASLLNACAFMVGAIDRAPEPPPELAMFKTIMATFAWTLITLFITPCFAAAVSAETPRYSDFKVPVYHGRTAPVRLDTPEAKNFRTRLREGAKQPVNFAGHYIVVTWGCGNLCQTGAVIDAKSGKVTFLPHTVCCWGETEVPFYYKPNSTLFVFGGMLDEQEPRGAHFFDLAGGSFQFLTTIAAEVPVASAPDPSDTQPSSANLEPAAGPVVAPPPTPRPEPAPVPLSADANAMKILLTCYSDGTDFEIAQVNANASAYATKFQTSKDNTFKAHFLAAGSFLGIADRVSRQCNAAFSTKGLTDKPGEIEDTATAVFLHKMRDLDLDYMKTCDVVMPGDSLSEMLVTNCHSRMAKLQALDSK